MTLERAFMFWLKWHIAMVKAALIAYEAGCKIQDLNPKRRKDNGQT